MEQKKFFGDLYYISLLFNSHAPIVLSNDKGDIMCSTIMPLLLLQSNIIPVVIRKIEKEGEKN